MLGSSFYSYLQCSRAFLDVRRVNTLTKREISTVLLNMGCVRAEVFTVNIDLRIALFSTSRTRSCLSRKREKKALSDSVTQCHCKRAHMKETIGEKSQSFMLSGKKYDKYAWYDKLLTSMSKKNARLQLQVNIFVLNCEPNLFCLKVCALTAQIPPSDCKVLWNII